ncbi:unnamed protein product [Caenorhabditis auriculariae]|uniref:Tyrosine-protein phosphatase domain-containing protein n=1 Tax=Caenorhabditis auriculariae TaxID=2777116 RepID=A0A8S1HD29_9PELO|nr:unnamed protein product [Caenorhabditis auriculariae]
MNNSPDVGKRTHRKRRPTTQRQKLGKKASKCDTQASDRGSKATTVDEESRPKERKKIEKPLTTDQQKAFDCMLNFVNTTLERRNEDILKEYEEIAKITPKESECSAFYKNLERNRCQTVLLLDSTRVVLESPTGDYIHASRVTLPQFNRKVIAAQLPLSDYIEEFWRMIFQENCSLMVLLGRGKEEAEEFMKILPKNNGDYKYFGTMFVNIRKMERQYDKKVDLDKENERENLENVTSITMSVEVLPDGCSNSIFCKVLMQLNWGVMIAPQGKAAPLATSAEILDRKETGTVCVVSMEGTGRAGTQLAIVAAMNLVQKGITPDIREIVTEIRKSRAFAVESSVQYATVFQAVLYYATAKLKRQSVRERVTQFQQGWYIVNPIAISR